jgi:Na+-translocating ferredoxin:NAD+ oxidoreductase subunit G
MKEMFRYGATLALVCVIASASLAVMNSLTKSRIIAQAQAEEEISIREVLPQAANFTPVKKDEEILCYRVQDKEGNLIGIAFKVSAKGYSSSIETMVGMNRDGTINAIKVISQNETPGLGARITEPSFTEQFKQKRSEDLTQVEAITGATISSKAVIDAVRKKAERLKEFAKE